MQELFLRRIWVLCVGWSAGECPPHPPQAGACHRQTKEQTILRQFAQKCFVPDSVGDIRDILVRIRIPNTAFRECSGSAWIRIDCLCRIWFRIGNTADGDAMKMAKNLHFFTLILKQKCCNYVVWSHV